MVKVLAQNSNRKTAKPVKTWTAIPQASCGLAQLVPPRIMQVIRNVHDKLEYHFEGDWPKSTLCSAEFQIFFLPFSLNFSAVCLIVFLFKFSLWALPSKTIELYY